MSHGWARARLPRNTRITGMGDGLRDRLRPVWFARGRKKWRRPTTCAKMRGSPRWIRIMSDEGIVIERRHWIYRHALATRVTHWINAVCLLILLLSGLQIFNAHP